MSAAREAHSRLESRTVHGCRVAHALQLMLVQERYREDPPCRPSHASMLPMHLYAAYASMLPMHACCLVERRMLFLMLLLLLSTLSGICHVAVSASLAPFRLRLRLRCGSGRFGAALIAFCLSLPCICSPCRCPPCLCLPLFCLQHICSMQHRGSRLGRQATQIRQATQRQ